MTRPKVVYTLPMWLLALALLLLLSALGVSVYVGYVDHGSIVLAFWPLLISTAIVLLCCTRGPVGRPIYRHCRETAVMRVAMRLRSDHPDKAGDWLADEPSTPTALDWVVAFVAALAVVVLGLGVADMGDLDLMDALMPPILVGFVSTMTAWRGNFDGHTRADDLTALASKEEL